ncbi:MAG: polyprenyl synthetase family protein [Calditrichia bacterium]
MATHAKLEKQVKKKISSLLQPYEFHINQFNEFFKKELRSRVKIVDKIANYIVKRKGKQFRPILVLLSGLASGEANENLYRAATVVELIHSATLVHDDVIDESFQRRGFPAIQLIWKNKVAVLMGDYLLSKSLIIATETQNLEFMNLISNVAKEMSQGELLQIEKSRKLNIDMDQYFKMISYKTASLISACCEIGALVVGADKEHQQALKEYGLLLGQAFQIKDDLLDYEGNTELLGKPVVNDLQDKKITLPLLYAFESLSDNEIKRIKRLIKKGISSKEADEIITIVKSTGGLDKAKAKAEELVREANEKLQILPPCDARDTLSQIADYVIHRNK